MAVSTGTEMARTTQASHRPGFGSEILPVRRCVYGGPFLSYLTRCPTQSSVVMAQWCAYISPLAAGCGRLEQLSEPSRTAQRCRFPVLAVCTAANFGAPGPAGHLRAIRAKPGLFSDCGLAPPPLRRWRSPSRPFRQGTGQGPNVRLPRTAPPRVQLPMRTEM
jgi:hypothetical protein